MWTWGSERLNDLPKATQYSLCESKDRVSLSQTSCGTIHRNRTPYSGVNSSYTQENSERICQEWAQGSGSQACLGIILTQREDAEKMATLLHHWCDCKIVQPLWNRGWWFLKFNNLQTFKIELPYNWVISFLSYVPKRIESRVSKRKLHIRVPSSMIYNSEEPEAAQMSTNGWVNK